MGQRPPQRQALEPPSRRSRPRDGQLCDARQDLQGPDRCHARVANPPLPRTRDSSRRLHRLGPAEVVVEIAFSDLQASPRYSGGLVLRLARVKRYREDKSPPEADSMAAVRRIAAAQAAGPPPP